MRIKQTEAPGFSYLMALGTVEYVFLKEALGLLADVFDQTNRHAYRALALVMKGEMEAASRVREHLSVQDQTVPTPDRGDSVCLPTMGERTGGSVFVRPPDRQD